MVPLLVETLTLEFRTLKGKNETLIRSLCCQSTHLSRSFILKLRGGTMLKLISNIQVYSTLVYRNIQASKSMKSKNTSIYVSNLLYSDTRLARFTYFEIQNPKNRNLKQLCFQFQFQIYRPRFVTASSNKQLDPRTYNVTRVIKCIHFISLAPLVFSLLFFKSGFYIFMKNIKAHSLAQIATVIATCCGFESYLMK